VGEGRSIFSTRTCARRAPRGQPAFVQQGSGIPAGGDFTGIVYHKAAVVDAWAKTIDFLETHLRAPRA
jgi:hypothetical protein